MRTPDGQVNDEDSDVEERVFGCLPSLQANDFTYSPLHWTPTPEYWKDISYDYCGQYRLSSYARLWDLNSEEVFDLFPNQVVQLVHRVTRVSGVTTDYLMNKYFPHLGYGGMRIE